jgi:transposase
MSRRPRRVHQSTFKSKVALEALKEQKTMSQLSEQYELHQNQINDWRKVVTSRSHELFESLAPPPSIDEEALMAPLYQRIGQLQMELDFLKKKYSQLQPE